MLPCNSTASSEVGESNTWHVVRTLRAIEILSLKAHSAPELAGALGIHARTARRMLKSLESEGYVQLDHGQRRRWSLTFRVVAVAGQVVQRSDLARAARESLERLRDEIDVCCHLCVPSHVSALCLAHAPRGAACTCRPQLRELVPCHCTAAGKALLAWRRSWQEAVLAEPLARFTDRTLVGPQWLRRELKRTVARGYAIEDREFDAEVRGVGVPLVIRGEAVAALAVVAPASHLTVELYPRVSCALLRAGAAVQAAADTSHSEHVSAVVLPS